MGREIIWTNQAIIQLNEAFIELLDFSESLEITNKIIFEIYDSVSILKTNSEIFKSDTLKTNNSGNIRAYQKHGYRLSYLIEEKKVFIIRVRHAKREPLEF